MSCTEIYKCAILQKCDVIKTVCSRPYYASPAINAKGLGMRLVSEIIVLTLHVLDKERYVCM